MNNSVFSYFYLVGCSFIFVLSGCTRPQNELSSIVRLQAPTRASSQNSSLEALPADKKACYGVSVTGPGIANSSQSCAVNLGVPVGFVAEGETLVAYVPKGDSRTFSLVIHLVEPSEACPAFDSNFIAGLSKGSLSYIGGTTSGVNLYSDEETVTIPVSFPGVSNTIASKAPVGSCQSGALKATLFSNGDVYDASGALLTSYSSPTNESFYLTAINDLLGIGFITSGGLLNMTTASATNFPPEVHSITRKPDTGKYYGLLHDGKIVELTISAGVGSYSEIAAGSCPFQVPNCTVPVWMQSMSAGYSSDLFSLDHAGNIYRLSSSGPIATGVSVSPAVTQVSFY